MVVELRSHSWFSFGAGVSSPRSLAQRAALLELPALGLADAGNLCGALEFAQAGAEFGVAPLFGVELRIREGERAGPAVLLAESGAGYANICRLTSLAHLTGGRREPELDFRFLESHAAGVIALLGGRETLLARLVDAGRRAEAKASVAAWQGCLGRGAVFLELQQHLAYGDTRRNRILAELAERCGAGLVASNAPYYLDAPEARLHEVYPRVCGGTGQPVARQPGGDALSPCVRGNLHGIGRRVLRLRSIPACAGEPCGCGWSGLPCEVYPRMCGGTYLRGVRQDYRRGLSPRVRGNYIHYRLTEKEIGSIPACAGEPRSRWTPQ